MASGIGLCKPGSPTLQCDRIPCGLIKAVSDSVALGLVPRICFSEMFPGDAAAAGPG